LQSKLEDVYGVILAAGNGSRLGYPNEKGGKPMVELQGKPLIYYAVLKLNEAGIKNIAVVVNPINKDIITKYLNDCKEFAVEISYIVQETPLGIAHALSLCKGFTSEHDLALMLVDNIFEASLKEAVIKFKKNKQKAMVFLTEVENPKAFGVANLKGDRVVDIIEKPETPPSNWAVIGFYLYDSSVYDIIKNLKPSARGELEITDVNKSYLALSSLTYEKLNGWWLDIGTPENKLKGEALLKG